MFLPFLLVERMQRWNTAKITNIGVQVTTCPFTVVHAHPVHVHEWTQFSFLAGGLCGGRTGYFCIRPRTMACSRHKLGCVNPVFKLCLSLVTVRNPIVCSPRWCAWRKRRCSFPTSRKYSGVRSGSVFSDGVSKSTPVTILTSTPPEITTDGAGGSVVCTVKSTHCIGKSTASTGAMKNNTELLQHYRAQITHKYFTTLTNYSTRQIQT